MQVNSIGFQSYMKKSTNFNGRFEYVRTDRNMSNSNMFQNIDKYYRYFPDKDENAQKTKATIDDFVKQHSVAYQNGNNEHHFTSIERIHCDLQK